MAKAKVDEEGWEKQEGLGIWLPTEEGEELTGTVKEVITEGSYGPQYVIENSEGQTRTPSHKVLQNRLAKVKPGDEVKLKFTGEEPPAVKGQNPTKMYEVFVKRKIA